MKHTLTIEGMSCGHCVRAVEEALGALHGVRVASVEMGRAVVETDANDVTAAALRNAVEEEGYTVTSAETGH
ncbi:MAG: copper resistance protein CopZ [Bacteroidetes bacterium CG12_big_fil_rev_8_21_14_0_65_60_17]|nr:MAG: copper resistance protein CopZ [Bacteroidetes bacterium CG12_big_fil_rev_8_21_14_0_65_60_17]